MDESGTGVNQELAELRARVAQLEMELRQREAEPRGPTRTRRSGSGERARRDLSDALRDASDRSMDESQRLVRGLTLAFVEQLHLTANVVAGFAEDLERRNDRHDRETLRHLPSDVSSSLASAIERSLDIPERVVDRFQETYRRSDPEDRDERRARHKRADRIEQIEPTEQIEPL